MTRDPLLPVRLVDGVWTTEGVVEIAGQTYAAKMTLADRPPTSRPFLCFPGPSVSADVVLPVHVDTDALRALAEYNPPHATRIALVALDGSGVHGIGADLDSAQAHALSTRDDDDPSWLDTLRAVTLSGEPAAVQALVDSLSSLPAGGDVWEGT